MEHSAGVTASDGITVSHAEDGVLVLLRGEIDASRRSAASACMLAVLAGDGPVTLDTSAVTFIDSSGLAFLLQVQGVLADTGRPVTLRDPSGVVLDLLALVGLDTLFVIEDSGAV